jgi:phosphatidylserine/phosphatidylglycerophosphate/cardiolipin synthase-like enzyme
MEIYEALSLSKENMKAKTGIYTLENGGKSWYARLWLLDNAVRSIDIQYYSFSKDVPGLIACDRIIAAAENGVQIRILIDDAAARMRSHEIQLLDSHEKIEIRVYNAGLMLGRLDQRLRKLAENSNRLLRRMHNKAIIIDDEVCITGGRNIANEYFDQDTKYNFRDRDIILLGKAVNEAKASFEKFWEDKLTIRYSELSGRRKQKRYNETNRFEKLHIDASKKYTSETKEKVRDFPKEIKSALKSGEFVWADYAVYVSDEPGKNEDRKNREGGVCTDSIINLFKNAKTSIDIQSPYFIITEESKKLITETIQRGVKIRLLTNSLASTDNHEAFSGYQRNREEIIKTGIVLYEFKPDAKVRFKLMIPDVQSGLNYKPAYGLHSKTMIIDSCISVVGSYNFDPRSANYNTECIAIIRSKKVARNLFKYTEEEFLPENAWKITLDYNPDKEAGFKKRMKTFSRRVLPKKLL